NDGVEVRRERDVRGVAGGRQNVPGAVDRGVPTKASELVGKPGGALLFEEGWGGDAAEVGGNFVDPLLLASEPLKAPAHAAVLGEIAQVHAGQCIGRHSDVDKFSRGGGEDRG